MVTAFYLATFVIGSYFYLAPGKAVGGSVIRGLASTYSTEGLILAVVVGFIGWLCFAFGYVTAGYMSFMRRLIRPAPSGADTLALLTVLLLVLGWIARVELLSQGLYFHYAAPGAENENSFSVTLVALAKLPLVSIALAGAAKYRGSRAAARAYASLIIIELAWSIPTGERAQIISLAVLVTATRYYGTDRPFRWKFALPAILMVSLFVFPFVTLYRGADGSSGYQTNTTSRLAYAWRETIDGSLVQTFDDGLEDVASRFSGAASLGAMITQGRERYPRQPKEAAEEWAGAFVPRFILSIKSDPGEIGSRYGKAYGIIASSRDANAAIAMTQPGDFFGTFGWLGLLLGLFAVGTLYRGISEYFFDRRSNEIMLAIYAAALGSLTLRVESSFTVGFFQTVKEILLFAVISGACVSAVDIVKRSHRFSTRQVPVST